MPIDKMVAGSADELAAALRALHARAGAPSMRSVAKRTGTVSHTTVAEALAGKRLPSWPILSDVISALGGDEKQFKQLWLTAREAAQVPAGRDGQDFVSRYLRQVAGFTGRLELPEPATYVRLALDQLYVPHRVIAMRTGDEEDIWALDDQMQRAVLLGDPGIGKSTVCRALMLRHAVEPERPVPFLITVREFSDAIPPARSVVRHIEHTVETFFQVPPPKGAVARLLSEGRALVIFDGLDELPSAAARATASIIELFCQEFPMARVLVTARLVGYAHAQLDPGLFRTYRLLGFSQEQISDYVRRWSALAPDLPDQARQHFAEEFLAASAQFPDIRSNPMLLGLTTQLYATYRRLPRSPTSLVGSSATLLLNQWDRSRGIAIAPISDFLEPALQYIAFRMLDADTPYIAEEVLLGMLTEFLAEMFLRPGEAASTARTILDDGRGRAWMITESGRTELGDPLYQFSHRTFMEYFAAEYLLSIPDTAHKLAERLSSPKWHAVAEFALELMNQQRHGRVAAFLSDITEEIEKLSPEDRLSALEFLEGHARRLAEPELDARQPDLGVRPSEAGITHASGQQPRRPHMDAKTAARVEKLGEVAYRHKVFIEEHGSMTRADSLAIRRQLFGKKVQTTANLFGKAGSGALLWRDRPSGTPPKDDDPIELTVEGSRIAELWRATREV
jgi:hypothetical protein